jgi:hypothetical protein
VALEPPLFVNVMVCELLVPVTTFPKLALLGVAVICAGVGFTVSVAGLLVTLPAALLTTTSKVDPLSDVVVTGVV